MTTNSDALRIFFAIHIPDHLKQAIADAIVSLQPHFNPHDIHWVRADHLHITLRFLESLAPPHLPELIRRAREAVQALPAFTLHLGPLELFPTPDHPRIISLHAEPHAVLTTLSTALGHCLHAMNYPIETRPFRAHLTLGRILHASKPYAFDTIHLPTFTPLTIDSIRLYQSELRHSGSRYTRLEILPLAT